MKKIIICALAALSVMTVLASCGGSRCSVCHDKCSTKNSYKDGEYVLCGDCQKKLFKETVESEPEVFFAEAEEVTVE